MLKRYLALGLLLSGCSGEFGEAPMTAPGGSGGSGNGSPGNSGGAGAVPPPAGATGLGGTASAGSPGSQPTAGTPAMAGAGAPPTAGGNSASGGVADPGAPVAGPRLARLTHFQWTNSVQDLLQLPTKPAESDDFTPDAIIGFDTNADQLRMSGTLREDYESAAEALATRVVSDPVALARLIPQNAPAETNARASAFIQSFGLKAYRRPLTATELDQYLKLFQQGPALAPDLEPFAAGVMLCIRLFLQSPHFLYRTELGQDAVDGRVPLSGYELAAKLSLAVTGSVPDEQLLKAAAEGALDPGKSQATVDAETTRLLATARGKAAAMHLQAQALALSRYPLVQRDPALYPEFKPGTPASLQRSAELFLGYLFEQNLGVRALLTSTEAFVDSNLAPIFGVTGSFGAEFQRVDVSALPRRGFLTQPGLLSLFAGDHQPDPIHRGVFINEQILCVRLGPPAANIPPLPEPRENETNRTRINALTGPGTCGQGCHATIINPIGFAFEHYDPLGRYRTIDGGVAVDASGAYPLDGQSATFTNALELVDLVANSRQAHRCFASHWLSYLYGRLAAASDATVLDALAQRSLSENLSSKDLIRSLVTSEGFLSRPATVQQP